jgi:hypothetical protein
MGNFSPRPAPFAQGMADPRGSARVAVLSATAQPLVHVSSRVECVCCQQGRHRRSSHMGVAKAPGVAAWSQWLVLGGLLLLAGNWWAKQVRGPLQEPPARFVFPAHAPPLR